jgi:D-alanyl-D-alanine carboxypeptidase
MTGDGTNPLVPYGGGLYVPQGTLQPSDPNGYAEPVAGPWVNTNALVPKFADKIQDLQQDAEAAGIPTTMISGARTIEQQRQLYANYQAKQAGQPLPYPRMGGGGLAAPPGKSYHNAGMAADVTANDPKQQGALINLARNTEPGLTPGANFGDPPHFQLAGPGGKISSPGNTQPTVAGPASSGQPSWVPPASPDGGEGHPNGVYTMMMLQALAPQHKFIPIDYDPYKVMPHVQT